MAGNDFRRLKDKVNPLTEIENLPIICLEKNTSTRRSIDEFLGYHGVKMEPEFELATSDMIVQFAVRNLGVGCVVKDFAEKYLESEELFIAMFDKNIPDRDMSILTDNKNPMSVSGKKLLEMLKTI